MKLPARILIVDDHPIVRLGLRQLLAQESDLSVCGEAAGVQTALDIIRTTKVDLTIVDLSLEDGSGLELIRQTFEVARDVRVLVLSIHDEALFAERALRAGASGYVMKQEAIDHLVDAVRHVLAGHVYVSERVSQQLLEGLRHRRAPLPFDPVRELSDREFEVFELIAKGIGTADIAERLSISVKTVETYRANIKTKLKLRDATDLIRYAAIWAARL
jgi:DNA-binding NarL/FixJ family response regulator